MSLPDMSYVGVFVVEGNTVNIVDPYICKMTVEQEHIPITNEKMVTVRNVIGGIYHAYHQVDKDGTLISLMALHSSYDLDVFKNNQAVDQVGYVTSALSGAVVLVDERYYMDTKYCYFSIVDDAYYDAKEIMLNLDKMQYDEKIKSDLRILLNHMIDEGKQPKGSDILDIVGAQPIWEGFQEMKSSQWSTEVINLLQTAYKSSAAIKGGIVSEAEKGFLKCWCYRNPMGKAYGFGISLSTAEIMENEIWRSIVDNEL